MRESRPLIAAARYLWEPTVLAVGLLFITAVMAVAGNQVLLFTLTSALIQMVLVIGLYIFIGNSGIFAFGHITYAMIGAYAAAWLTMPPFKKASRCPCRISWPTTPFRCSRPRWPRPFWPSWRP